MRKQVTCKSGLIGYQTRLCDEYHTFADFESFSDMYGLAVRLGFGSAREAWDANPLVQGSTNPADYCRVLAVGELPIHIKVVVELQVSAEEAVPEWKIREGAEQAVRSAVEAYEQNGFVHQHADILSIGLVDVETAANDLN